MTALFSFGRPIIRLLGPEVAHPARAGSRSSDAKSPGIRALSRLPFEPARDPARDRTGAGPFTDLRLGPSGAAPRVAG